MARQVGDTRATEKRRSSTRSPRRYRANQGVLIIRQVLERRTLLHTQGIREVQAEQCSAPRRRGKLTNTANAMY